MPTHAPQSHSSSSSSSSSSGFTSNFGAGMGSMNGVFKYDLKYGRRPSLLNSWIFQMVYRQEQPQRR